MFVFLPLLLYVLSIYKMYLCNFEFLNKYSLLNYFLFLFILFIYKYDTYCKLSVSLEAKVLTYFYLFLY